MERVINLNNYQPKQALYRSLSIVDGKFRLCLCYTVPFVRKIMKSLEKITIYAKKSEATGVHDILTKYQF